MPCWIKDWFNNYNQRIDEIYFAYLRFKLIKNKLIIKLRLKYLTLFVISLFFYSCSSNSCDLGGCDRVANGWTNGSECAAFSYSVCRMNDSGGYCTKDHAIKGK